MSKKDGEDYKYVDLNKLSNAELWAHLIEKQKANRYPSPMAQLAKLMEEVGELAKEVNIHNTKSMDFFLNPHASNAIKKPPVNRKLKNEAADVALAVYGIANAFGFDLDAAMRHKVSRDNRDFSRE